MVDSSLSRSQVHGVPDLACLILGIVWDWPSIIATGPQHERFVGVEPLQRQEHAESNDMVLTCPPMTSILTLLATQLP